MASARQICDLYQKCLPRKICASLVLKSKATQLHIFPKSSFFTSFRVNPTYNTSGMAVALNVLGFIAGAVALLP